MEKSHVSLEQNVCPICGVTFETNSILIDRHLRKSMERHTVTGVSMCTECESFKEEYLTLVEIDKNKSGHPLNPETAWRTGRIARVRRNVVHIMFNNVDATIPFAYAEKELIDHLEQINQNTQNNE